MLRAVPAAVALGDGRRLPPRAPHPSAARAFRRPRPRSAAGAAPADAPMKLEIAPASDCWVSLTVDGRKLFARVMQAGERESHRRAARGRSWRSATPAPSRITVNGRAGKPLGDKGQVKTLKITPATAAQYFSSTYADPGLRPP